MKKAKPIKVIKKKNKNRRIQPVSKEPVREKRDEKSESRVLISKISEWVNELRQERRAVGVMTDKFTARV